ncbi:hypothetical protein GGTG_00397 [Gaeumannomyces tritici R3-111a-1]|uniref:Dystroglycan-type cadherin-like domain-containing protein n=1 Tax=Gaeumannomyces tritici (strain R3-111a-1) TaxID=644352 RepID=J3NGK7_GAET3|nr:hypothetical protein GGTG_00397 [Gaeumannomyces tritici R3-111a-1]EJT80397.1 hypothetical protein GGTG_00397 [Gaeumannomyces tritici R3-111a-1]
MASLVRLGLVLLLTGFASAAPSVSFPINSQVPPVARISEPFSFIFSSSTFTSDLPITYSFLKAPKWLSIDGKARRLFGTPKEADVTSGGDVVGVPIEIVATDRTGSTTHSATLIVSKQPSPEVLIPSAEQVPTFGPFSQPSSLLSYPERPFSFAFSSRTFSRTDLEYYAVTADNSPLPAWISFDPEKLAFTGRTPPFSSLVEPPQTFGFKLVASDVPGFSALSVSFSVVVGNHQLTATNPTIIINATSGTPVANSDLKGKIKIDGQGANPVDIASTSAPGIPPWLTFDKSNLEFKGTPPTNAQSTAFPLILKDAYENALNITVQVNMATDLFRSPLKDITLKAGSQLLLDLKPYLWRPSETEIELEMQPRAQWVRYDPETMTISGDAPRNPFTSTILLKARAVGSTGPIDERALMVSISRSEVPTPTDQTTSTSPASPSTSAPDAPDPAADAVGNSSANSPRLAIILPAILVPVSLLLVAFVIICICCRRRRKGSSRRLEARDISGPVPGSYVMNGEAYSNSSLQNLNAQFDTLPRTPTMPEQAGGNIPAPASAPAGLGLRGNHNAIPVPPVPDDVGSAHGRGGGAWSMARALAGRKSRKSKTKSYLSDTSFYDEPRHFESLYAPLPGSTVASGAFRGNIEVDIPTLSNADSIQQTPESKRRQMPGADAPSSSRPPSMAGSLGVGKRRLSRAFGAHKGTTAADFIQSLKRSADTTELDLSASPLETREAAGMIDRPRPAAVSVRAPSSLPVSRRGQGSDGTNSLRGSGRLRDLPHSRGDGDQDFEPESPSSPLARFSRTADPFATPRRVPASRSATPSVAGAQTVSSLSSLSSPTPLRTGGGGGIPNWTIHPADDDDASAVVNEWVVRDANGEGGGGDGSSTVSDGTDWQTVHGQDTVPNVAAADSPLPPPVPARDLKRVSRYSMLRGQAAGETTAGDGLSGQCELSKGSSLGSGDNDFAIFI